ncbi:hypothetical protein ACFVQ4_13610 [Streptomyces laurentii]|uniref:hypothetical protein n=1 Tax=Streptomyces laurentii TaxID=39478 RepID=UPI003675C2EB
MPALIVSEPSGGRYVERTVAEAGRETAIEAPFPLKLDPSRLVNPGAARMGRESARMGR